ncbi:hypothetical protein [Novipirellula sp.]
MACCTARSPQCHESAT